MFRGLFWDILAIVSVTLLVLGLAAQGLVPTWLAALAIAGLAMLRALGRGRGGGLGRLVRRTFAIALVLTSLGIFLVSYGQGDPAAMRDLLLVLGVLAVVVFGLYVMVRGISSRK